MVQLVWCSCVWSKRGARWYKRFRVFRTLKSKGPERGRDSGLTQPPPPMLQGPLAGGGTRRKPVRSSAVASEPPSAHAVTTAMHTGCVGRLAPLSLLRAGWWQPLVVAAAGPGEVVARAGAEAGTRRKRGGAPDFDACTLSATLEKEQYTCSKDGTNGGLD